MFVDSIKHKVRLLRVGQRRKPCRAHAIEWQAFDAELAAANELRRNPLPNLATLRALALEQDLVYNIQLPVELQS